MQMPKQSFSKSADASHKGRVVNNQTTKANIQITYQIQYSSTRIWHQQPTESLILF